LQRCEQNGRHFDSAVHGTGALHCGHLTTRGFIQDSLGQPDAGVATACVTSIAAVACAVTTSSSIASPAKVIIAAAASVTTVSTAAADASSILMMDSRSEDGHAAILGVRSRADNRSVFV
jgi:hypothetical protein